MLFIPSGDEVCGLWTRSQLFEMDARFTARVEAAFQAGLESRSAARATVRVGRNGKAAALEGAWKFLISKEGQVSASEVVAFVRERCPNIDQARVRAGLAERFRQRGVRW
jgi:hypothetical protein